MTRTLLACASALLLGCGGGASSSVDAGTGPTPPVNPVTPTPLSSPSPTPTVVTLPAGSLDPTFGTGGVVRVDFPRSPFVFADFGIDEQDGFAILAETIGLDREFERQVGLLRLDRDGSTNDAFGTSGFVETAVAPTLAPCAERSCYDSPSSVLVLPDDRVLVSAAVYSSALEPEPSQGALLVFRPDGTLDPSFGDGGVRVLSARRSPMFLGDLQFDHQGRIIAPGSLGGAFAEARFLVARLLAADVSPDTTFGMEGIASVAARDDLYPGLNSVGALSDGSLFAGGGSGSFNFARPEVTAFTSDGALDTAFGDHGFVAEFPPDLGLMASIDDLIVDHGPGIVVAIRGRLARYTPSGALDPSFGDAGVVDAGFDVRQLLPQSGGRVLAVGNMSGRGVLARWQADGNLDPTFGSNGTVAATVDGLPVFIFSAVLDSRGSIVVLGTVGESGSLLFLARYVTDDIAGLR